MIGGDPRPDEVRFVALFLRVVVGLTALLLALNLATVIVEGGAGNAIFAGVTGLALVGLVGLLRQAAAGEPGRAIERFFVVAFAGAGASTLAVAGNGVLLGLVLVAVVLVVAPRALPPARADRWMYGALGYLIAVGVVESAAPSFRVDIGEAARERAAIFFAGALVVLGGIAALHFRRYPFATKLAAGLLLAALGPFAATRWGAQEAAGAAARAAIEARVRVQAERAAGAVDGGLTRLHDAIRWLADDEALVRALGEGGSEAEVTATLERWLGRALAGEQRGWAGVFVVKDGVAVAHGGGAGRGRAALAAAAAARAEGRSRVVVEVEGEAWIFLAEPIRRGGQTLVAAIQPELVRAWVTGASGDERFDYALVEEAGGERRVLIAAAREGGRWAAGPPEGDVVALAGLGWAEWAIGVAEGEAAVAAAVAAASRADMRTLVLLVALATLAALVLSRRIAAALSELGEAMRRFGDGDTRARAPVSVDDEIGVVAGRFNHLAEQLGALLEAHEAQASALRAEVAEGARKEERLRVLNAEHAAARDAALAANRAKSTFLAQMSHELRTPLNAIIGYTELIAEEAAERGAPTIAEDARRVLQAAHHLLGIISDILDLSKIEAGKHEVTVKDFDVLDVVQEVCETVRPAIGRKDNELVVIRKVERLPARSDRIKLRQALLNLLSNAAKFTSRGRIEVTVDTMMVDGEPWVTLAVRDEGIGIPSGKISLLFEPFTQVDNSPTRRFDGTGLGLAITRRFCRMLGGDVSVESELGRGSVFTIRVPARAPLE